MSASQSIPFLNYSTLFSHDAENYIEVLRDTLSRGAFVLQNDVAEFEKALREYLGITYAFGVSDGTNALILGLHAAGIGVGDEIILPGHCDIAMASAVHFVGATPVLADIEPNGLVNPASIEQRVGERTAGIGLAHVNGRTCDMDAIRAIAERFGIRLFEDADQALGAKYKGQNAGTFGTFATFSFDPAGTLGCFGDAGAIVTNDDELARKIGLLRNHGRGPDGRVVGWGTSSRLDNIQAAILKYKFRTYRWDVARRREIAAHYDRALGGIDDLTLPPGPQGDQDRFDVFQSYEVKAGRREALRSHLDAHGIGTMVQWDGRALHHHRELELDAALPATDRYFERCFLLPMNTALTNDEVDRICQIIGEFYDT